MSTILIIDDSPEDRELFTDLLEQADPAVQVAVCSDGTTGVAKAGAQDFDCVLLDLRLDGEDGLDVLANLHAVAPALPVIVFTGQGSEKSAADAFQAGAAYYLPKQNLTGTMLWTAVTRAIEQAETTRELAAKRDALERSNRLDAVGQLAAGLAHDFNNQLAALRFCIELLKPETRGPKSDRLIKDALKIIDESALLAGRMVALSRQGDLLTQNVPLQDTFADLQALTTAISSDQISLEITEPATDLTALCDPGQLLNTLLNMVLNAADAIKEADRHGTIKIRAIREADTVHITIKDNGIGMSQEVLTKCVDPFFTTKNDAQGTGLGLAMVQSFVNDNGGQLLFRSAIGSGTDVTMILPVGQKEDAVNGTQMTAEPPKMGKSNILVVEDQIMLAMMSEEILEQAGYSVAVANDGQRALEILSTNHPVDVIVTDIKMPGMDGFELASEVKQRYPQIEIIFLTGYAEPPSNLIQEPHVPVLQKPIAPDKLLATIDRVLTKA